MISTPILAALLLLFALFFQFGTFLALFIVIAMVYVTLARGRRRPTAPYTGR